MTGWAGAGWASAGPPQHPQSPRGGLWAHPAAAAFKPQVSSRATPREKLTGQLAN